MPSPTSLLVDIIPFRFFSFRLQDTFASSHLYKKMFRSPLQLMLDLEIHPSSGHWHSFPSPIDVGPPTGL